MMKKIKTFVINLEERTDRKAHALTQFALHPEFDLTIVKATQDPVGSWGLWLTIKKIITTAKQQQLDTIIICEDDHTFTKAYDKKAFFGLVENLKTKKADILLGGASWFDVVHPVASNCFWIKNFNGLQFTVIFKHFYDTVLAMKLEKGENADICMAASTNRSFVCYPYISVQQEFGYSDVTVRNSRKGYISGIFDSGLNKLHQLHAVASHYKII